MTGGPSETLQTVSRWAALLGLAALLAVWPIWSSSFVLLFPPPGNSGRGSRGACTGRVPRVHPGVAGSASALVVQALGVGAAEGLVSGLTTTLSDTRYGSLWLMRLGLFLCYAAALIAAAWWRPWRHRRTTMLALVLATLLPLPFSLISHAAAQPTGHETAIAVDALHTLAAALWAGGLFILVTTLGPTLRELTPAGRQVVLEPSDRPLLAHRA